MMHATFDHSPTRAAAAPTAEIDLLVVGAGFAGMLAAIEARRRGIDDVPVIEKGSDFGGCWRENTYPGVACDNPLAPLFFPPQPERRPVAHLLAGRRDLRLCPARRPRGGPLRGHLVRQDDDVGRLERRSPPLGGPHRRGRPLRRSGARHRHRTAAPGEAAGHPRPRQLCGRRLPLGGVAARLRTRGQARHRHRQRRHRHPVRARDRQGRRPAHRNPALGSLRDPAPRRRAAGLAEVGLRPRPRRPRPAQHRPLLPRRRDEEGHLHPHRPAAQARHEGGAPQPREGDRGSGPARQADPRLRDRLQARPDFRHLVSDPRPAERRPRDRRRRRGPRRPGDPARPHRDPRRRHRLRHRLPRRRLADATYEPAIDKPLGPLNPCEGYFAFGAAATYALPSGTKITAGAEYAWLGDADVVSGGGSAEFTDNSTIGLAMKIAVPF